MPIFLPNNTRRFLLTTVSALAFSLMGCGGGGTQTSITLSGIAATGAAFTGAVVRVIDSRGTEVGTSETVGDDGVFSIALSPGASAPFVLTATRTSATGESESLVSVVSADRNSSVNITPITNLIASRLSPSGNPTNLAAELVGGRAQITTANIEARVTEVQTILEPLLAATGTRNFNPISGSFAVNGTGYDRLLDSVTISIVPSSATTANIEIAVRQAETAESAQPNVVSFTSASTTVAPLPEINASNLVEPGTSAMITDFLTRLTACYALPLDQRVTGAVDGDNRIGGASAVSNAACRDIFHGNSATNYRNNGGTVGRNTNNQGEFAGLFRAAATNAVFSQGAYQFTRPNGDIVASFKTRDTVGNESFSQVVLRKDSGKLRLIGNQYDYPGAVYAFQQRREFITLDQGQYSYMSTGYSLDVANRTVDGVSIYNRVVVTAPSGKKIVLRPSAGLSYLAIRKGDNPDSTTPVGTATSTNILRLRSEYLDGSNARAHPSNFDTSLVFAINNSGQQQDFTETDLTNIPNQSNWKLEYYLANQPTVLAATQTYKTRSRAMTIGELRTQGMTSLAPALTLRIQQEARTAVESFPGQILSQNVTGPINLTPVGGGNAWSVPTGVSAPTSVTLHGSHAYVSFNDDVIVGSSARTAVIPCTSQGEGDNHCATQGNYAANVAFNGLHLIAKDSAGRSLASYFAIYKLQNLPVP